jgi:hypothetical protein
MGDSGVLKVYRYVQHITATTYSNLFVKTKSKTKHTICCYRCHSGTEKLEV